MARSIPDPDAELDATAIVQRLLRPEAPSTPQPDWTPPEPAPRRTRRSQGRSYGPDSIAGLADYFTNACPPLSWAGGLEIGNRRQLMAVFSELRRGVGLSPSDCRAMVDLYISRLAGRTPSKPYVWDFKWRRFQLLRDLRDSGVTVTSSDYDTWQQPTQSSPRGNDEAFIASWGNP